MNAESSSRADGEGAATTEVVAGTPSARLMALFGKQRLTPIQRRIAQCLTEHSAQAAFLSSNEVSVLAGVSQPSVTRFAMAIGFDGYGALQREIRRLVSAEGPESLQQARQNEWQAAVLEEITNLQALVEDVTDSSALEAAGGILMSTRPLPIVGLRAAIHLASYIEYFAAKLHPDTRLLADGGSILGDRLEQARAAGATAALFVVVPRYPREEIRALRFARNLDLTVVSITDSLLSPVAEQSDITLAARVGRRLVFDSHATITLMAALLLQSMCDAGGADCQSLLERFEQSAAERVLFEA